MSLAPVRSSGPTPVPSPGATPVPFSEATGRAGHRVVASSTGRTGKGAKILWDTPMKWFPDFTPIRSAGPMGQVGQADLKDLTDFFSLSPACPALRGFARVRRARRVKSFFSFICFRMKLIKHNRLWRKKDPINSNSSPFVRHVISFLFSSCRPSASPLP